MTSGFVEVETTAPSDSKILGMTRDDVFPERGGPSTSVERCATGPRPPVRYRFQHRCCGRAKRWTSRSAAARNQARIDRVDMFVSVAFHASDVCVGEQTISIGHFAQCSDDASDIEHLRTSSM